MADQETKMVQRTVFLPPKVDDGLRVQAFRSKQTKNDVIRKALTRWLSAGDADGLEQSGRTTAKLKSSANDGKMILRTVYLPPELDDRLRVLAFRMKQSKGDLIREAVVRWPNEAASDALAVTSGVKPKASSRTRLKRTAAAPVEA